MRKFPQFCMECGDLTGSPKTNLTAYVSFFENALRALRAFPRGKKHQKLRTFGYPPRDHENRGGPEAGNLQQQVKNSENFAFIFQIRKQQETRKI